MLKKEAADDVQHKIPTLNPSRSAILNDIKRSLKRSKAMAIKREEEDRLLKEGKTLEKITKSKINQEKE